MGRGHGGTGVPAVPAAAAQIQALPADVPVPALVTRAPVARSGPTQGAWPRAPSIWGGADTGDGDDLTG